MKTSESIEQLHELVNDQERKLDELQRQIQEMRVALKVKPKNRTVILAEKLRDMMVKDTDQPFIDRDLFSTDDILTVAESYLGNAELVSHGVYGSENNRKRTLCTKLVNSGLFMRLKGQQYVSAVGFEGVKPYSKKHTVIVANDFKKYEGMTQNQLFTELRKQEDMAMVAVEARRKAEVAKEPSFL